MDFWTNGTATEGGASQLGPRQEEFPFTAGIDRRNGKSVEFFSEANKSLRTSYPGQVHTQPDGRSGLAFDSRCNRSIVLYSNEVVALLLSVPTPAEVKSMRNTAAD